MRVNGIQATTGGMATGPQQITTSEIPADQQILNEVITIDPAQIVLGGTIKNLESLVKGNWLQHSSLIDIPTDANATSGNVILNVAMVNQFTSKVIRLYMLLGDRFIGNFDYRLTVFGASTVIGAVEIGLTLFHMDSPTINDLRILEGKTIAANDTNVYTFTLGPVVPPDGIMRNYFPTHDLNDLSTFPDPATGEWSQFPHLCIIQNAPLMTNISGSITSIKMRIETRLNPEFMVAITNVRRLENIFDTLTATAANSYSGAVMNIAKKNSIANWNGKTLRDLFVLDRLYVSTDGVYSNAELNVLADASNSTETSGVYNFPLTGWTVSASSVTIEGYALVHTIYNYTLARKKNEVIIFETPDQRANNNSLYAPNVGGTIQQCWQLIINTNSISDGIRFIRYELGTADPLYDRLIPVQTGIIGFHHWGYTTSNKSFLNYVNTVAGINAILMKVAYAIGNALALVTTPEPTAINEPDPLFLRNRVVRPTGGTGLEVLKEELSQIFSSNNQSGTLEFSISSQIITGVVIPSEKNSTSFKSGPTTISKSSGIVLTDNTCNTDPSDTRYFDIAAGIRITDDQSSYFAFPFFAMSSIDLSSNNADPYYDLSETTPGILSQPQYNFVGPRNLSSYTFSVGEYFTPPNYSLFQRVPEGFQRLVFTQGIPPNVSAAIAQAGLPTVGSLMPKFPELTNEEVIMFDLITPQNRQTIMRCAYSPYYKAFFTAFNGNPAYAVYNTHDAASLIIGNCATYSIGTLPAMSPNISLLSRVTTGSDDESVIDVSSTGPLISTLPRKFLKARV